MSSIIIILFFLSFPIFWFYGLIVFFRNIFGYKTPVQNQDLLNAFVSDLDRLKKKQVTVKFLYDKYKQQLVLTQTPEPTTVQPAKIISEQTVSVSELKSPEVEAPTQTQTNILTQDMNDWWNRWYEENNINLLLYIGAFLIVSSAAIFVGFNWETVSGAFKAMILTIITLAFFVSGFFFYSQTPKLKNAGSTFLAIGSLLIPFNGLAWYNFALRDSLSFGMVWFTTSLLGLVVYFSLAYLIRNRFYTYIAGLGGLSLVEALVNIGGLNSQFYILGGIFSAFALLAGSKTLASVKQEDFDRVYSQPLSISSSIVMPIFLTWGLTAAYSTGKLFTPEVYISSFLATGYYFLSYIISKNISILTLAELLLTLSLVLLTKTAGINGTPVFLVIFLNAFIYLIAAFYLNRSFRKEEGFYTTFVSIFISTLGLAISLVDPLISVNSRIYFSLIVSLIGLGATLVQKNAYYLYVTAAAIDLAAFIFVTYSLKQPELYSYLGLFYLATGCLSNIAANLYFENKSNWGGVFFNISLVNLIFSAGLTFSDPPILLLTALIVMATAFYVTFRNGKTDQIYSIQGSILISLAALGLILVNYDTIYLNKVFFCLIVATMGLLASYRENKPAYLFITLGGIDLATFIYTSNVLTQTDFFKYLGLFYLIFGVLIYLIGQISWKPNKDLSQVFLSTAAFNFALAFLFTLSYPGYSLLTALTLMAVGTVASYYLEKGELFYLAIGFSVFAVFNFLRFYNVPFDYYPLAFSGLGFVLYLLSLISLPKTYQKISRDSSLLIAAGTPLFSAFNVFNNTYSSTHTQLLEFNSLVTAYIASGLLVFEALRSQKGTVGYFASVATLLTILWQYNYLGINEIQVYTITIGLYFLGLSYIKRGQQKKEDQQLFDTIGLLVLFGPLTLQALPETGALYALLLGIEGVLLTMAGFSLNYKTYTYAGTGAIALATLTRIYSFVSSLPSWAVIGLGGLVVLGVAIYLQSKRNLPEN